MPKREANQAETAIADRIIEMLDGGQLPPWERPWRYSLGGVPHNATSGRPYSGINRWICNITQELNGWLEPRWLTARQVEATGGTVVEGAEPTQIVFWKFVQNKKAGKEEDSADGSKRRRGYPMARLFRVYNVAQTEGCDLPEPVDEEPPEPVDPVAEAEAIIENMPGRPEIAYYEEGNQPPHYDPRRDRIAVPDRDRFYNTMFHELTHSTGHPDRLGRFKPGERPTLHEYGAEELVAGMGAAILADSAGLSRQTVDTDASYLQHWRDVIAADKKIVILSAQRAEKAVRHIRGEPEAVARSETVG